MTRRFFFTTLFGGAAAGVGAVLAPRRGVSGLTMKVYPEIRVRHYMATLPPNHWTMPILFKRQSD